MPPRIRIVYWVELALLVPDIYSRGGFLQRGAKAVGHGVVCALPGTASLWDPEVEN